MPLRELKISLPKTDNDDYVIASKCQESDIGLSTLVSYEGVVSGFATVNSRMINLMNGRTIDDSYFSVAGRRIGILEKKNARIAVYGYRKAVNGCTVGFDLTTEDVSDGAEKTFGCYWEYSLEVVDHSKLIELMGDNNVFTFYDCMNVMNNQGRIRDIMVSVVMKVLETTPFSKLRGKLTDISKMVTDEFLAYGGDVNTGFKIVALSLGNMEIRSSDRTVIDRPRDFESGGDRFGGALNRYGTNIGDLLNNNRENTDNSTVQGANDVCDIISKVEDATVEVICKTEKETSGGTAFLISEGDASYLITNFHVICDALRGGAIAIRFSEKINPRRDNYLATIVSIDPVNDLAILGVHFELPSGLSPLELGDISTLRNGQAVVTVGHPREFSFNAIQGSIANTRINMGDCQMSGILCAMPAAPGNSGGAVVRISDGKVIGVSTAIKKPEYMQGHTICVSADAIRMIINRTKKMKEEE